MLTLGITTPEELRQADHKAVIAWERYMRETEHAAASTIRRCATWPAGHRNRRRARRRLAALSSLYKYLVRHDHAPRNPVGEVERPALNRDEGSTLAFSCKRIGANCYRQTARASMRKCASSAPPERGRCSGKWRADPTATPRSLADCSTPLPPARGWDRSPRAATLPLSADGLRPSADGLTFSYAVAAVTWDRPITAPAPEAR